MKSTLLPILVLLAAAIGGWRLGSGQARQSAGNAQPAPIVPPPILPASFVQRHYDSKEELLAAVAEEWAKELSATATPEGMSQRLQVIAVWASVAPAEAWRTFQRDAHLLPSEDQKEHNLSNYILNIINNWANNHGWENARQGTSDAPDAWRASIGSALGSALKNQRGAGDILKTLIENPAPDRAKILAAVLSSGGTGDFIQPSIEEWKTWLTTQADPDEREILASAAFHNIRGADPKASADWFYGLEGTPEQKGKRLNMIVFPWATSAPNACGEWLNTQHLGPEADEALDVFAEVAMKSDPESAVAWAQRIQDPKRREEVTLRSLSQWRRRSPTAAAAARERLGLTPPR